MWLFTSGETLVFLFVSPFPTPFPRMGKKHRKLQKLQKGYKQWLERKNRGDDESRPTVSSIPPPPVAPAGPSTATSTPVTSPTSEDEDFIKNVGLQSTLDKRASLIREVISVPDVQITDERSLLLSVDKAKAAFQAASPLCGICLGKLEICFDESCTTGTKTPFHDETAYPRTPSGEVHRGPAKAH